MSFQIEFKPSRYYFLFSVSLHLISLVVLFNYFSGIWAYLLITFILLSGFFSIYSQSSYSKHWISSLRVEPDGRSSIALMNGKYHYVKLSRLEMQTSWVLIIVWNKGKIEYRQTIFKDMLNKEQYHQLFLWLKWLTPIEK